LRCTKAVVLSEAKDLIADCNRHEILRSAQDDRGYHFAGITPWASVFWSARPL
jgi:hypothetical protein